MIWLFLLKFNYNDCYYCDSAKGKKNLHIKFLAHPLFLHLYSVKSLTSLSSLQIINLSKTETTNLDQERALPFPANHKGLNHH